MKTTLVVGVVVAIVVLVGILAIFLSVGKHSVTTSSNTMTSSTYISSTRSITTTTTTSTTTAQPSSTTPNKLQPDTLYLLNYSNGTYWFVAVLNVTFPANPVAVSFGSASNPIYAYQFHQYHLYGYTELVFSLTASMENEVMNSTINDNVFMTVSLSDGEVEFFQLKYIGNWTFGSI